MPGIDSYRPSWYINTVPSYDELNSVLGLGNLQIVVDAKTSLGSELAEQCTEEQVEAFPEHAMDTARDLVVQNLKLVPESKIEFIVLANSLTPPQDPGKYIVVQTGQLTSSDGKLRINQLQSTVPDNNTTFAYKIGHVNGQHYFDTVPAMGSDLEEWENSMKKGFDVARSIGRALTQDREDRPLEWALASAPATFARVMESALGETWTVTNLPDMSNAMNTVPHALIGIGGSDTKQASSAFEWTDRYPIDKAALDLEADLNDLNFATLVEKLDQSRAPWNPVDPGARIQTETLDRSYVGLSPPGPLSHDPWGTRGQLSPRSMFDFAENDPIDDPPRTQGPKSVISDRLSPWTYLGQQVRGDGHQQAQLIQMTHGSERSFGGDGPCPPLGSIGDHLSKIGVVENDSTKRIGQVFGATETSGDGSQFAQLGSNAPTTRAHRVHFDPAPSSSIQLSGEGSGKGKGKSIVRSPDTALTIPPFKRKLRADDGQTQSKDTEVPATSIHSTSVPTTKKSALSSSRQSFKRPEGSTTDTKPGEPVTQRAQISMSKKHFPPISKFVKAAAASPPPWGGQTTTAETVQSSQASGLGSLGPTSPPGKRLVNMKKPTAWRNN